MSHLKLAFIIYCVLVTTALCVGTACSDGSKLAVGDIISVVVDGENDFSKAYQINDGGSIDLPVVEPLKVLNMNTSEAAAAITKLLESVLVNPQVSVTFVERGKMQVFVVGQVKRPGLAEVGIGDRVLQALAQAGYDEDQADLSRVNIRRGDEIIDLDLTKYLSGEKLETNIALQSGDTIVVPRIDSIGSVLVVGQVNKVGSMPIKRGMTFKELMGLVGDVKVEADTERIEIKRDSLPERVRIDYKRAMDGDPSADIALQPGDTVYVPEVEKAYYTVMGGVSRPGQYPLKGKMTLSEAIGEAGGPVPNMGDLRKVQLIRKVDDPNSPGETTNINLDSMLRNNPAEQPLVNRGDVVWVAVHKQKMSLWQVIQSLTPFGWLLR